MCLSPPQISFCLNPFDYSEGGILLSEQYGGTASGCDGVSRIGRLCSAGSKYIQVYVACSYVLLWLCILLKIETRDNTLINSTFRRTRIN